MESDAEFVERILADFETFGFDGLDIERMRALARRGAAVENHGQVEKLSEELERLRAAGLHKTSRKILEQAARIRQLETGLWDVHAYCNNWDWFLWMWPIRRIKRIARAALKEKA